MKQFKRVEDAFGGCEGPLGFPMKDGAAKQLEGLLAGLDGDCRSYVDAHGGVCRVAKAPETMELRPAAREEVSLITTEALDLDKEVLVADGIDWSYFEANGKNVTWAHNYTILPVGQGMWFKAGTGPSGLPGVLGATRYAKRPGWFPEGQAWFADVVCHYIFELGQLKGKSIGFVPTAIRKPTKADVEARAELADCTWMIARAVALEWAVCVVQCQPEAIRYDVEKARALGVETPELMLKSFGLDAMLPAPEPATRNPEPSSPPAMTRGEVRAMFKRAGDEALAELPATLADALDVMRGRV